MEESINLYSTFYRGYDPQLGRFNGVDVMSEQSAGMSPYHFGGNNPIMMNDPLGNLSISPSQFYQYSRGIQQQINDMADPMDHRDDMAAMDAALMGDTNPDVTQIPGGMNFKHKAASSIFSKIVSAYKNLESQGYEIFTINMGYKVTSGEYGVYLGYRLPIEDNAEPLLASQSGWTSVNTEWVALPEIHSASEFYSAVQSKIITGDDDWVKISTTVSGSLSLAVETTEQGLIGAQRLANGLSGEANAIIDAGKMGKNIAKGFLFADMAFIAADAYEKGLQWHHLADASADYLIYEISAGSGPIGWIIGGAYFFGNLIYEHYHDGHSMTEDAFDH